MGGGGGGRGAPVPAATGDSPAPKIVLPSLPELLSFVATNSDGRVVVTPAAAAAAAAMEEQAVELEHAYSVTLDYMELWRRFQDMVDDDASGGGHGDSADADAATSDELRRRIIACYRFLAEEGGAPGSVDGAVARLQAVSDLVAERRLPERLRAAAGGL